MTIAQLRTFIDTVNADEGAYPCTLALSPAPGPIRAQGRSEQ